jgi:hypothetical protein
MRLIAALVFVTAALSAQPRFEVSWPKPADGHLVLIVSTRSGDLRNQVSEGLDTAQIFGADVDKTRTATIDAATLGYPRESLRQLPAGDYNVQAVLNVYETFHLADGRTLELPMDQGEGQHWNRKPGNLYSEPMKTHIDPASSSNIKIELTKTIPPIDPPQDTKFVKHVRIQSKLLTAFWGRPMYLGAIVVLPDGFAEHPNARYPVMYSQGHFQSTFTGFRTEPPPPPSANAGRGGRGANAEYAYKLYQDWTGGKLPRMLIVITQDPNPFYDDSYAVNSANVGPYGDALTQELYPYVEKQFRAIGQPWARTVYGGSTGGWRTMALQVLYPDFFNGAWIFCPDPIDFRAYALVNLYRDENAFFSKSQWKRVPIPMMREGDGTISSDMDDAIRFELALGTHGRSTEQFDIWQAVYSPVGPDGYPALIIDPKTGAIDRKVAEYWKEHYDLDYIMQRDWKTLGPKLAGKLHFTVGEADTYYLERAVHLAQQWLGSAHSDATFDFGPGRPHCYTGNSFLPQQMASGTLTQRMMTVMLERIMATAPPGADVTSWRY